MKTVASLLLVVLSFGASAQVREVPVATPQYGPAEGDQSRPLVATNGTDFLVAWSDSRFGSSIFATRVTRGGTVLDPTGIPVTSTSLTEYLVSVLWCRDAYVIVMRGENFGAPWFTAVARVDIDGKVIDGPRIIAFEFPTAAATNGSRIMLATERGFMVLDNRANFIEETPTGITGAYAWTLASNGSSFLAAAATNDLVNQVRAFIVDSDARILHGVTVNASTYQLFAVATSNGYDILFDDIAKGVITRFSLDDNGVGSLPSEYLSGANVQAVTQTNNGYLVAVRGFNEKEIRILRGGASAVLDQSPYVTSSGNDGASWPALASNGANVLFVWKVAFYPDSDLRGVILDDTGHATSREIDVAQSANQQEAPAIASGGRNDLVAWQEKSGIYATRVTADGVPLDGRGIFLGTGSYPEVIFDGSAYMVVWREGDLNIRFRRVDDATGVVLGPASTISTCSYGGVQIACDDIGVVAFLSDCNGRLFAQRVGAAGTIGPAVGLTPEGVGVTAGSAVYNGREWLVAWNVVTLTGFVGSIHFFSTEMQAERLPESLTPVETRPLEVATSHQDRIYPLVATNGTDFIVAWSYPFESPLGQTGVYGRTVSAEGVLGDPMLMVAGRDLETRDVAWDGARYVVAYAASRDASSQAYNLMLTHAGVGDQLAISGASPDQHEVALAAAPGRPLRAAYTRIATEPQYGYVSRVFIRDLVYDRRRLAPH